MSESNHTVRRATLDDLPVLRGLWETARLPAFELEKRLTEFQVAVRPDGVVSGTMGFRVAGWHALLHSEAFYSSAEARVCQPLLWDQFRKLALGQGAARLWMAGPVGAFWQEVGFARAGAVELNRLPSAFGPSKREWHTLALRDDALIERALEKEFVRLREEGQAGTARMVRQASIWKWLAGLIAVGFFMGAIWLLFEMLSAAARR